MHSAFEPHCGSAAAAAGGYTAVVAMPNTDPPIDSGHLARYVTDRGRGVGLVEVASAGCVTMNRSGERLAHLDELWDAGVRMFSDDGDVVADAGLMRIVEDHTREAGVRNLEREISSVCRKLAREVLKETDKVEFRVSEKTVSKFLGPYRFRQEQVEEKDQVGMVTGLAWTQVGGELLFIETLIMPGKGKLTVTGKLGEVMQESARAALSYARANVELFKVADEVFDNRDIHIHVPAGAIPKDGPSAGITIATALVSSFTDTPVRVDLAIFFKPSRSSSTLK